MEEKFVYLFFYVFGRLFFLRSRVCVFLGKGVGVIFKFLSYVKV